MRCSVVQSREEYPEADRHRGSAPAGGAITSLLFSIPALVAEPLNESTRLSRGLLTDMRKERISANFHVLSCSSKNLDSPRGKAVNRLSTYFDVREIQFIIHPSVQERRCLARFARAPVREIGSRGLFLFLSQLALSDTTKDALRDAELFVNLFANLCSDFYSFSGDGVRLCGSIRRESEEREKGSLGVQMIRQTVFCESV